jgi:hypothetical protein
MVLPAGVAPATVWFEASCAHLLRYGSSKGSPTGHGASAHTSTRLEACCLFRTMARRCTDIRDTYAGLDESGCPTWNRTKIYGFRDRRATVALQGRNWRGPTAQGQSSHDLLALGSFRWGQRRKRPRHRVPGSFPRLHRNQVSARRYILYS